MKRRTFQRKGKRSLQSPRTSTQLLLALLVGLFLLAGCGEGTTPISVPKEGARPAVERKKTEPAKAEEIKEGEKEEFAYNASGKPDPFKPFLQSTALRETRALPLTPLQKYDVSQLKLVAVLSTPEGRVGLVEDATGKGYLIQKGTWIGKNEGKVTKILADRVMIEEFFLDPLGQKKVNEVSLSLQKAEEGGEK